MIAIAPVVLGLGAQALAGGVRKLFGGGKKKERPDPAMAANLAAFDRMAASDERTGDQMTGAATAGLQGHDPDAAFRTSMGAMFEEFKRRLGETMGDIRGSAVSGGRIDTGFLTGDEDRAFATMGRDLNNTMADRALQTSQQNLSRFGTMADIGNRSRDRAMEARFGRYATDRASRDQRDASKRSMWGSLGAAGIGLASRLLDRD